MKNKLTKLKNFLKEKNLDFFLQPNSDEFFSEYLPENQKRIEFLTNFTGSNAFVLFGVSKSYFFTDSRYLIQAAKQIDLQEFEIIDVAKTPLISFLNENITAEQKLALDANLTSVNFAKKLKIKAEFLQENLIDLLYPAKICQEGEVFAVSTDACGVSFEEKIKLICEKLKSPALLISKPEDVCWLLNIRSCDIEFNPFLLARAILLKTGKVILFANLERFKNLDLAGVEIVESSKFYEKIAILRKGINEISFDFSSTNYAIFQELLANDFEIINQKSPIELVKAVKNSVEIAGMKLAHEIDGLAIIKFLFWLEKSLESGDLLDEVLVADKLQEFRGQNSAFLYPSFATIAGFAQNGAIVHYQANEESNREFYGPRPEDGVTRKEDGVTREEDGVTIGKDGVIIGKDRVTREEDRVTIGKDGVTIEENGVETSTLSVSASLPIVTVSSSLVTPSSSLVTPSSGRGLVKTNSLLLIDSGAQYLASNFCATTDITRTIVIGTPSAEMIRDFTLVLKGHIALASAKFPLGTSGSQLDILARNFLYQDGKNYGHGTGHGVGCFLGVHEGPCAISPRSHLPLQAGMILSNEPGFYKEGEYGIRIENLVLIEKFNEDFLHFKTISLAPIDARLIDFTMLRDAEKTWLKNYHQEILEKISPKLDEKEQEWLSEFCEIYL